MAVSDMLVSSRIHNPLFLVHHPAAAHQAPARTMSLSQTHKSIVNPSVPNVSDCGLFGTDCDGNSYLEVIARVLSAAVSGGLGSKFPGQNSVGHRDCPVQCNPKA